MSSGLRKLFATLCGLLILASLAVIAVRLSSPGSIDTDIQSVLPHADRDPAVEAAIEKASEAAAGRVAFLVTAPDAETAREGAADLDERLTAAGLYRSDLQEAVETAGWVFANRDELMCGDPEAFDAAAAGQVRRRALAQVYSVTGAVSGSLLRADPFLRTLQLADCLAPAPKGTTAPGEVLVTGRLTSSAYSLDTQSAIAGLFAEWRADWTGRSVSAARTGAVFHAAAGAEQARNEVTRIGLVGLAGVIFLFGFVFRRGVALLAAVATVGAGLAAGVGAALLLFDSVHVLVFVFAAMLVGIASDYAIHVMATGPASNWSPVPARTSSLARPLTISMLTSVLGFGALAVFGVELLQQVAVMAGVGLAMAWAFVLFILLPLDRRPRRAEQHVASWQKLVRQHAEVRIPSPITWVVGAVLLAASLFGATRLTFIDDVRQFQARSADLLADEDRLAKVGYVASSGAFLLTQGATPEEARASEARILATAPEDARILAISRLDPDLIRRQAVRAALRTELYDPLLANQLEQLGLDETSGPPAPAAAAQRPVWFADFEGESSGGTYLIAPILDPAGWVGPGAGVASRIIDPASRYSSAFTAFRTYAVYALLAAILSATAVVLAIYRSPLAISIVLAPLAALAAAILLQAAIGLPLTFFSLAGGLVLLGVGLDYAAFEWEAGEKGESWTPLAILIDAVTTFLSMGLLAFSGVLPVRSFGMTVAIGIVLVLVLSRIARYAGRRVRA